MYYWLRKFVEKEPSNLLFDRPKIEIIMNFRKSNDRNHFLTKVLQFSWLSLT